MKVLCVLADGFEDVEALAPVAMMRRAGLEVDLCALNDLNVTGSHGTRVIADKLLSDVDYDEYQCLMLPGGKGHKLLEADSFSHLSENFWITRDLQISFMKPDRIIS